MSEIQNNLKIEQAQGREQSTIVVELTLNEVNAFHEDPSQFRTFFLKNFPDTQRFFEEDSEYGFRGARTNSGDSDGFQQYQDNITSTGAEFAGEGKSRPVGLYIQPGSFEDSYERSVHFAFGKNEEDGLFTNPQNGDVGVFSVYQIKDGEKVLLKPEASLYPGEGASWKKWVPSDTTTSWADLRQASLVFKIIT